MTADWRISHASSFPPPPSPFSWYKRTVCLERKEKTTELEIKNGEERDVCIMDEFEMLFRLNKFKIKKEGPLLSWRVIGHTWLDWTISYLLLLLLFLLHVRDQMSVGFDFGTEWRRRRRRIVISLMKNERRMMASCSGRCCEGVRVAVSCVMFNIQLVAAANRPRFQQRQTAMLIAAH